MGDEIINDYRNGFYYYEGEIMNPDRNERRYAIDPNDITIGYGYYIYLKKGKKRKGKKRRIFDKIVAECVLKSPKSDEYIMQFKHSDYILLTKHSDLPHYLDLCIKNGAQLVQVKFNYSQLKELLSIENK